jgi:hypothetical protein
MMAGEGRTHRKRRPPRGRKRKSDLQSWFHSDYTQLSAMQFGNSADQA